MDHLSPSFIIALGMPTSARTGCDGYTWVGLHSPSTVSAIEMHWLAVQQLMSCRQAAYLCGNHDDDCIGVVANFSRPENSPGVELPFLDLPLGGAEFPTDSGWGNIVDVNAFREDGWPAYYHSFPFLEKVYDTHNWVQHVWTELTRTR